MNLKEIVLYCSIIKRELFDLVVQKATEIGKGQQFHCSKRTVKQNVSERLRTIAKKRQNNLVGG